MSDSLMSASARTSRMANIVKSLRLGLFGALFVMSKTISSRPSAVALDLLIRLAQLLSFIFTTDNFTRKFRASASPIAYLAAITTPQRFMPWLTSSAYIAFFYVAIAWVVLFTLLLVWAMYSFVRNSFTVLFPLKVLRVVGQLSTSILFIPLVSTLFSPFECAHAEDSAWQLTGYDCFSPSFMGLEAVAVLLACILFFLCSMFALVFYDSNPLSRQVVAKAHGRADFVFLLTEVVLVLVLNIFSSYLNSWVLICTLILSGIVYTGSMLWWMPFYHHKMNSANIAIGSMFSFASFCLIFNEAYPGVDAAVLIYVGLPPSLFTGLYLSNLRANHIMKTPAARLSSAFELELKTRYMLHTALWGHPTDDLSYGANANFAAMMRQQGGNSKLAFMGRGDTSQSSGAIMQLGVGGGDTARQGAQDVDPDALLQSNFDESPDDLDQQLSAVRKLIPPNVLQEVHAMYRATADRLRHSSFLHIFFSRFFSVYQGNRHMQMSHLLQAEKRRAPLDVSFIVFQARKRADQDMGAGSQMSALNRVTFEKYAGDARRTVLKAAVRQLSFWAELCDPESPDLSRLHRLSSEMNTAMLQAEKAFNELFAINPSSLAMMRLYAAFNMHVACNVEKANVLLAEADRLEDQKSKDHRSEGGENLQIMSESTLDVLADNTAVISVGGTSRNLGVMITVNSAACKMFGFSRLQFERRSVFTLMPHPLDEINENYLRQYGA